MIAADEKTNRIIIAIGRQRVALDMSTRITRLPPDAGDQPAKILPFITLAKARKRSLSLTSDWCRAITLTTFSRCKLVKPILVVITGRNCNTQWAKKTFHGKHLGSLNGTINAVPKAEV